MDYEKEYKAALERCREFYAKLGNKQLKEEVEDIFPELAESEDEQMRKKCIELIKELKKFCMRDGQEECIAWLEAQGEKKPADKVEPKFKVGDRVIGIVSGMQYYITEICDDYYNTESGCIIMFYAQDNFELYKQKPTWSEEELDSITAAINNLEYLKNNYVYHQMGLEPAITFLKSLKYRVLPQLKQEWSEEDEKMLGKCIDAASGYYSPEDKQSMKDWLKSLKGRYTFKPSDEQMEALRKAEATIGVNHVVLAGLISDLEKLKG